MSASTPSPNPRRLSMLSPEELRFQKFWHRSFDPSKLYSRIGLCHLVLDESIHARAGLDMEWVRRLSKVRLDGKEFPPIGVIQDPDGRLLVYSGFHRVEAARRVGDPDIRYHSESGTI